MSCRCVNGRKLCQLRCPPLECEEVRNTLTPSEELLTLIWCVFAFNSPYSYSYELPTGAFLHCWLEMLTLFLTANEKLGENTSCNSSFIRLSSFVYKDTSIQCCLHKHIIQLLTVAIEGTAINKYVLHIRSKCYFRLQEEKI